MKIVQKTIFLSLLFSIFFLIPFSPSHADDQMASSNLDQKDTIINTPFNRADYEGSCVVIAFVSHYCKACIKTMGTLNKLNDKYAGSGMKFIVIYADKKIDENEIKKFTNIQKIQLPVYIQSQNMVKEYKVTFIPTILFFDTSGRKIQEHIGHKKEKVLEENFTKAFYSFLNAAGQVKS